MSNIDLSEFLKEPCATTFEFKAMAAYNEWFEKQQLAGANCVITHIDEKDVPCDEWKRICLASLARGMGGVCPQMYHDNLRQPDLSVLMYELYTVSENPSFCFSLEIVSDVLEESQAFALARHIEVGTGGACCLKLNDKDFKWDWRT